jgi:hypothetical protein
MYLQKKWCNFYPFNVYILNKVRSRTKLYITSIFDRKHYRFNTGSSLENWSSWIRLAQKSQTWPSATTSVNPNLAKSLWLTSNKPLTSKKVPLIHALATFQGSLHQNRRYQVQLTKTHQLQLRSQKYLNLKRVPVVKCLSRWNLRWANRKVLKTCKNIFHHRIRPS